MGNDASKPGGGDDEGMTVHKTQVGRVRAVLGGKGHQKERLAQQGPKANAADYEFIMGSLTNLLLFAKLDKFTQQKIVSETYERTVTAGEILIQQGDTGLAATQLFVVKSGKFEVLEKYHNSVMRKVNTKERGDCFGEISLMYNCPRSATVAATTDAVVWVLDREVFRANVQLAAEQSVGQVELFLNSVPLLSNLTYEQKVHLVDAFVEEHFAAGLTVISEGDVGDKFYIVKEGEATVIQAEKEVNRLLKADFFGEQALLHDEPRKATVKAATNLIVLSLDRKTFVDILGPLQDIMNKEKSAEAVNQRMSKLKGKNNSMKIRRPTASVVIKADAKQNQAVGHLDEVTDLRKGGTKITDMADGDNTLVLIEGELLGEGAFSKVCKVTEETTGRQFALKRMTKGSAMQCPEHVYSEQEITRNMAHPFCLRQYASFQDKFHLYSCLT